MTTETDIQRQIQLALSSPTGRMFRNTVGEGWHGKVVHQTPTHITLQHYRHVKFGLAPGSSDLIGLHSLLITPQMVGRRVAVFTAIEVKRPKGKKAIEEQRRFIEMASELGGISGIARSPDQAIQIVSDFTS